MEINAKVVKVSEDEQLVFGWASVSMNAEGELVIDSQGDSIEPHELELAAYDHVLKARATGEMHEGEAVGELVESMVMTPEKAEAMGLPETKGAGWWVGYHIEDSDVFAKVKDGTYKAFSIQGVAAEVVEV